MSFELLEQTLIEISFKKLYQTLVRTTKRVEIYSLRHRKCGVRGFIHELFVSKTRTSEVRASESF